MSSSLIRPLKVRTSSNEISVSLVPSLLLELSLDCLLKFTFMGERYLVIYVELLIHYFVLDPIVNQRKVSNLPWILLNGISFHLVAQLFQLTPCS